MKRLLFVVACLLLMLLPPLGQGGPDPEDRLNGDRRGEVESLLELLGENARMGRGGRGSAAGFLLRSGDATIAVRCDPRESMKTCVELTAALLEKARASLGGGGGAGPQGNTPPRP